MGRFCGWIRTAFLFCATAAFMVGGCTSSATLDELAGLGANTDTSSLSETQVLGLLQEAVASDSASTDSAVATAAFDAVPIDGTVAETPTFGEPAAEFETVPADAAAVSVGEIASDTQPIEGVMPRRHGTLAGRFESDRPGASSDEVGGVFRGRWFNANDEVIGYVRGEYRPLPADRLPEGLVGGGVFDGRLVDMDGHFRGFLRGRYGRGEEGRQVFFGHWQDRFMRLIGAIRGHWVDDEQGGGGEFAGRWAAFDVCGEADSLAPESIESPDPYAEAAFTELDTELAALEATVALDVAAEAAQAGFDPNNFGEEPDLANDDPPCVDTDAPYGVMRGWHVPGFPPDSNPPERADGRLRGHWRRINGTAGGHVVGVYELLRPPPPPADGVGDPNMPPPSDGGDSAAEPPRPHRVHERFVARIVRRNGEVIGTMRGVFGAGPHGVGVYRARIFNADGVFIGLSGGRWDDAPEMRGGPFFGGWSLLPRDGAGGGAADPNDGGSGG